MDKLKHPCFIIPEAISPRFWTGFTENDVDILIKSLAYLRGPLFLDYVLPYFTTPWRIPDRLDRLTAPELENLQKLVQIRALVEAMTMSPMRALEEFVRRTVDEPATQWALLATEFQPLIDAAAEQSRWISAATTLSPPSMARLFASYCAADGASNHVPKPFLLVG